MAVTRLGLHGGPRRAYAAFTDRSNPVAYTRTYTRLGLYGGPRRARTDLTDRSASGTPTLLAITASGVATGPAPVSSATFVIDSVTLSQVTSGTIQVSKRTAGTISVSGGVNGTIDFNTDID